MITRIVFYIIGFLFMVIGFTYFILYLNLFAFGYNILDYLLFMFTNKEGYYFLIGFLMILCCVYWRKKK